MYFDQLSVVAEAHFIPFSVINNQVNALNFNQILTSRQSKFFSLRGNNKRVGLNAIANRFFILNNRIPLNWFNLSIDSFKVHCKSEFLS